MKFSTRKIALIGVMAALASVIMFFELQIPLIPTFLKLDFSEIAVLFTAFAIGPIGAVFVELIKNLIHLSFSQTSGIGELANFLVGSSFVITAGLIYKKSKNKMGAITAVGIATLVMVVFSSLLNYVLVLPLYAAVLHMPIEDIVGWSKAVNPNIKDVYTLIVFGFVPFNLLKALIISILTVTIYKSVEPVLKKSNIS